MFRRPTIAMGDFVSAVSRNGCLFVARQNKIAGAVAHPRASDSPRQSSLGRAKCARFGHRHNALDNPTIIRMIVLLGRFELYVIPYGGLCSAPPMAAALAGVVHDCQVLTITSANAIRIIATGVFMVTSLTQV